MQCSVGPSWKTGLSSCEETTMCPGNDGHEGIRLRCCVAPERHQVDYVNEHNLFYEHLGQEGHFPMNETPFSDFLFKGPLLCQPLL